LAQVASEDLPKISNDRFRSFRSLLIEPQSALPADLIGVFHQQSNKKERKANEQHNGENYPAAGADLLERVRALG
jgi:hypothetical protein